MGIGDALEIDLIGVNLFHTAVFNRDDVVVEDHAAVAFEFFDDLIQAIFVEKAHKRQAEGDAAPVLAAEFVMHEDFIAPALHLLFYQGDVDAYAVFPRRNGL